jgi:hypothetical protein
VSPLQNQKQQEVPHRSRRPPPSTTAPATQEEVQLLYVPVEALRQHQHVITWNIFFYFLRMVSPILYKSRSTVIRYLRRNFVCGFLNTVISLDTRCPKSHRFYVSFVKRTHNEQCFNDKLWIMTDSSTIHSALFVDRMFPLNRNYIENRILLDCNITTSGNSLLMIGDDLWGPSSRDSWPSTMELIGCPETSARNYHYMLRNNPEECSSHLVRGGGQKSQKLHLFPQEQIKLHVV